MIESTQPGSWSKRKFDFIFLINNKFDFIFLINK